MSASRFNVWCEAGMVLMIGEEMDVWLGAIVSVRECKMFWAWICIY